MMRRERARGTVLQPVLWMLSKHFRFMFVEFRHVDDANLAISALNGHPFDAKHTFRVNHFTDIERYVGMDEAYVEPELEDYIPRVSRFFFVAVKLLFCELGTSPRLACRPSKP